MAVRAQDGGSDGPGIRLGDFELHPGIGSSVGYLSNVYSSDDPQGTGALRVNPSLYLTTLGPERRGQGTPPPKVALKAGASGSFQTYFATTARDAIGAELGLEVTINPERPVSFVIEESLKRTASPFTESGLPKNTKAEAPDYGHNTNMVGGKLVLQTPGGLLNGRLGYAFTRDWFDDSEMDANDASLHALTVHSGWEFLPKTALFHDASLTFLTYDEAGSATTLSDSRTVSTRMGVDGGLSSVFGGTIAVGYTAAFFDNDRDSESVIVNVEARYVPAEYTEVGLGYERELAQSYQGGTVTKNRVYARARLTVAQRLTLASKAGVEFQKYGIDPLQGPDPRRDIKLFADASADYKFVEWFAGFVQLGFVKNITDFEVVIVEASGTRRDKAEYTAFEGWLGVRAFY